MGQIRTGLLCAAALFGVAGTLSVHADPANAIGIALDRFQSACATALTDPDAYIASLAIPGPAGEDVLYPSDDGHYLLVHTTQSQGLTDYVEFADLPNHSVRRCRVTAVFEGFPDVPEIAQALTPLLQERSSNLAAGLTRQVAPIWEPGDAPMAFEAAPQFIMHATGLLPGTDALAFVAVQTGGVAFSASAITGGTR